MITVAFWNVHENATVLRHLRCLAIGHHIDVILLAESPEDLSSALDDLNALGGAIWREEANAGSRVRALSRLGPALVHRFTGIARDLTIWSLRSAKVSSAEVLLAGVHLTSKMGGTNEADQAVIAHDVMRDLNDIEDQMGHRHTAVVGDFNMPPYDVGMTSVTGFHGLMTKKLANKPDRKYRNRPHRRFYNPMWGLMGDRTPGPPGSYRWRSSAPHNPHWSIMDQVLLRKDLIGHLLELKILSSDGTHDLVRTDGFPDKDEFSDHLPLLFSLDV